MALKDIVLKLIIDGKESIVTLDKLDNKTLGLQKSVKNIASAMGLAFGAREVITFMKDSVALVQRENEVIGKLNATLKSTNYSAGMMSDELVELANNLEELTNYKFDDKDIIDAEGLLLTFTKINKEIFPETMKLALDMSVRFEQDLKSSIIQIGKALQEPEKGITALRKVGVTFTEQQEELIKSLIKENDLLSAQKIIMGELSTQVSGSAAASVDAYTLRINRLNEALEDVKKVIGDLLSGGAIGFLDFLGAVSKVGFNPTALWMMMGEQQKSKLKKTTINDILKEAKNSAKGDISGKSDADIKKLIAHNKAMYNASFMGFDNYGKPIDNDGTLAMLQAKLGVYESALIKSDKKVTDKKKENADDFYKHLEKLEADYLDWEKEVNKNRADRLAWTNFAGNADMTKKGHKIYDLKDLGSIAESSGKLQQVNFQLSAMDFVVSNIREGFESASREAVSFGMQSVRVFKTANSVLQVFINSLVQSALQMAAMGILKTIIGAAFGGPAGAIAVNAVPMATGGIVTGPTLAMLGEAGVPEAVIPLDKLSNINNNSSIENLLAANLKAINDWADRLAFEFEYDSFKTAQKVLKLREDYRV